MKDYSVTITVTMSIQAKNDEQAQERTSELEANVILDPKWNPRWAKDVTIDGYESDFEEMS